MRKPGNPTGKGGFKKGQSGNPGGRPKELKGIQELARSHAEMSIETLAKIAKDGQSETARASAASAASSSSPKSTMAAGASTASCNTKNERRPLVCRRQSIEPQSAAGHSNRPRSLFLLSLQAL